MIAGTVHIGIDVGSVTVKLAAIDEPGGDVLWSAYRPHRGCQREVARALVEEARARLGLERLLPIAVTGSGAQSASVAGAGAPYVQEVNALVAAARVRYPHARSLIELGGEDAKMIFLDLQPDGATGVLPFMNDKCAAGTGAMLDRLVPRIGLDVVRARSLAYTQSARATIAAKCGVFAETDVVNLLKSGVARDDVFLALLDAIVQQNLATLAHGRTPAPDVLLLGGPHAFYPTLGECWRARLEILWRERGIEHGAGRGVVVPHDALLLPAIGAVVHTLQEDGRLPLFDVRNLEMLFRSRDEERATPSRLYIAAPSRRRELIERHGPRPAARRRLREGEIFRGYLGIDCGSTTIKSVLLDTSSELAFSDFAFAGDEPIADARASIGRLSALVEEQGARLEILSAGVTGYARDLLAAVLEASTSVVETVAHARSAMQIAPTADVVCDVGGQDIKVLLLRNGRVADFRLNTQCSAGTGYFLQSVAERFGLSVEEFAEAALGSELAPKFNAGCGIFLQSDIVNCLRQGYSPAQIMAGISEILPQNIWIYAARIHDLPALGSTFVLQGGTQRNAAAVHAQVLYIEEAFAGTGRHPCIIVHPHAGEAGAIGAALAAADHRRRNPRERWHGIERLEHARYRVEQSETTRCSRCTNGCARTIVEVELPACSTAGCQEGAAGRAPEMAVTILAPCERGRAVDELEARARIRRRRETSRSWPDFAEMSERLAFSVDHTAALLREESPTRSLRLAGIDDRDDVQVRMPRVLNMFGAAPLLTAYLLALGVLPRNIVFSPRTSADLVRSGGLRGTIDPCFPAKLCFAHVEHLLRTPRPSARETVVLFPAMSRLHGEIADRVDSMSCTVGAVMPEVVNAALTLERDAFAAAGMRYLHPVFELHDEELLAAQAHAAFAAILGGTRRQHRQAIALAMRVRERAIEAIRAEAARTLRALECSNRLGLVMLGRPYQSARGVHHGILDELNALGYPIFTPDSLPRDRETLASIFDGRSEPSVSDVWPNPFSENSNRRIWAAKFAARHPNLLAIELSSFKCGHDAPMYSIMRKIFAAAGKPYFTFLDLDENRPVGSLALRIETLRSVLAAWERDAIETTDSEHHHEPSQISATAI